ncbi:SlyX family protein [Roseateles chitinivorans]|nr:SlyX family protein [Roseateles chitinivorans]
MSADGAGTGMAAEVRVLEARVTELEIKASFAEDLVDHLNAQVARQQEQIDALVREIAQLRKQVPEGRGDGAGSLRDELPPHY